MAAQGASNGHGANKIGDMSDLLGLSKLQEVLQTLAADQAKADTANQAQEAVMVAATEKIKLLDIEFAQVTTRCQELQRQLDLMSQQNKVVEEAQKRLSSQEAQLGNTVARLALLEKQVEQRLTSLESKVGLTEETEEQRYGEVKAEILALRLGQNLRAPAPPADDGRA
ncbi:unnamed protein product, partial [Polarella glacialis]